MFAFCPLSIVPVRKEPSDRSEMVTQLLFGERVEVIDKQENWRKIRISFDGYSGWVDKKQLITLEAAEYARLELLPLSVSLDIVQLVVLQNHQVVPVVLGSTLTGFNQKKFVFGSTEFQYEGNVSTLQKPDPSLLLENAYMYLNAPYLWGGRSPFGIDCSGFTQMAFKLCGIAIKRDAAQQAEQGTLIHLLEEANAGDLAFFDNAEGKIVHVGIILPNQHILHASGRVRIDTLDHQGIFNQEQNAYTHNLRLIKRMY
ncbi:MAG: C40 family peptidase [Bacteroidetes bacterium]|nr:C40 family peptidase [Bacteroidota bacterium]MBL0064063.1 C40 family peptidase [Bacteroidota bacterium]MBL0139552.1 C40 family peptidase [Bacteroidota bacterium]